MRAVGFLVLLGSLTFAQKPDAAEILRKVATTYSTASQYHFVLSIETTSLDEGDREISKIAAEIEMAVLGPDHALMDVRGGGTLPTYKLVVNGNQYWAYVPRTNRFFTHKSTPVQTEVSERDINDDNFSAWLMQFGGKILVAMRQELSANTKQVREEPVTVAGERVPCWVILLTGSRRVWVDQKRFLILREEYTEANGGGTKIAATMSFKLATVNQPISEDLFIFRAPAGSLEVRAKEELGLQ